MADSDDKEPDDKGEAKGEETPLERAQRATRELRRDRARRLVINFVLWVGVPTLVATIYYCFIATPQYESVAVLTVNSGKPAVKGKKGAKSGASGVYLVHDFVLSQTMANKLAANHGLVEDCASPNIDWLSRLRDGTNKDAVLEYYQDLVTPEITGGGATLKLHVRAFSADSAHAYSEAIVAATREMLTETSMHVRSDLRAESEKKAAEAEDRLAKALKAKGSGGAGGAGGAEGAAVDGKRRSPEIEIEFARENLKAVLRSLEQVEAEAARRQQYLVVAAEPTLPSTAKYPRKLWIILTVFFSTLSVTAMLGLLGIAVREHARL